MVDSFFPLRIVLLFFVLAGRREASPALFIVFDTTKFIESILISIFPFLSFGRRRYRVAYKSRPKAIISGWYGWVGGSCARRGTKLLKRRDTITSAHFPHKDVLPARHRLRALCASRTASLTPLLRPVVWHRSPGYCFVACHFGYAAVVLHFAQENR